MQDEIRVIEHPATAPVFIEVRLAGNLTGVGVTVRTRHSEALPLVKREAESGHYDTLDDALDALPGFCRNVIANLAAEAAGLNPRGR